MKLTLNKGCLQHTNARFLRQPWEIHLDKIFLCLPEKLADYFPCNEWVPYIKGAEGKAWFEPLSDVLLWKSNMLEIHLMERDGKKIATAGKNEKFYFQPGVAVAAIGANFRARVHRFRSVFDVMGQSVFPEHTGSATCLMNTKLAQSVLVALNPSIHFQVGDIKRLPLFPIESADEIFAQLDAAFTTHEAARETSVEFKQPGASCWNYAQQWAQQAVDREAGAPLPEWNPIYDQPPATNWVSYAIGVALGRFDANGEGIRSPLASLEKGGTEPADQVPILKGDLGGSLPNGILYLSTYATHSDLPDSLEHPACQPVHTAWNQYGSQIAKNKSLRDWLRLSFFKDVHLGMYEQRPIYFPLSSKNRNFVAYISIHRWTDNTLTTLLADHLTDELRAIEGELADLVEHKGRGDSKAQAQAEKRYGEVLQLLDELKTFIERVRQCVDVGPPKADPKDRDREANARFKLDLDDGVMINSAALWSLLEPQWNKPKGWWSELCNAKGKKDYDWAHLAARYFPDLVDQKCQADPSLAVAHGCFWKYHLAKAYEWELRLQDEIAPDFTIDEVNSDALRQAFEEAHPDQVVALREKEAKRRDRKQKKQDQLEMDLDEAPIEEDEA